MLVNTTTRQRSRRSRDVCPYYNQFAVVSQRRLESTKYTVARISFIQCYFLVVCISESRNGPQWRCSSSSHMHGQLSRKGTCCSQPGAPCFPAFCFPSRRTKPTLVQTTQIQRANMHVESIISPATALTVAGTSTRNASFHQKTHSPIEYGLDSQTNRLAPIRLHDIRQRHSFFP